MIIRLAFIAAALALAGCDGPADRAPGELTASENDALNDAAAMLDVNSVDAGAVGGNGSNAN